MSICHDGHFFVLFFSFKKQIVKSSIKRELFSLIALYIHETVMFYKQSINVSLTLTLVVCSICPGLHAERGHATP